MEKIGFIGLGSIGKPMCKRLIGAGYDVTVHDIRQEVQEELVRMGAKGASSPRQMAQTCGIIVSMVRNDSETEQIMTGPDGIMAGMPPGVLIVLMSTISPSLCKRMNDEVSMKGGSVIDAAVSGSLKGAEEGSLTIMAGGDKRDFDRGRPLI